MLNSNYEIVREINPLRGSGYPDMHEFRIIDNSRSALMIVHQQTNRQIFRPGTSSSLRSILNSGFVEIDLESEKVVFEWWALDHVDPTESLEHVPNRLDATWDWLYVHWPQFTSCLELILQTGIQTLLTRTIRVTSCYQQDTPIPYTKSPVTTEPFSGVSEGKTVLSLLKISTFPDSTTQDSTTSALILPSTTGNSSLFSTMLQQMAVNPPPTPKAW